jgi:salicylate hydroxylase
VHSLAVEAILGASNPALPTTNYNFAYRFLIPTKELLADPETAQFAGPSDDGQMKFFLGDGQRLVWYPCRKCVFYLPKKNSSAKQNSNEEQNFVAIFHSESLPAREDWQTPVGQSALLERYSDFHPSILAVLRKARDIKQWPLLFRAPIPTWHKGKLVLIGDAAHPMLPRSFAPSYPM